MLLTGFAVPYYVEMMLDESYAAAGSAEPLPPRCTVFHPGAFQEVIYDRTYVDVILDRCRVHGQDLGSTQHGLHLFETRAGLYFDLRLPSTFAEKVYRGVLEGTIRHVCASTLNRG